MTHYTNLQYDHHAIQNVDSKLFRVESSLYDAKWWDYKIMHPTQATIVFAECYRMALKRGIARRRDVYMGRNYKGFDSEIFYEETKSRVTGLWKGRQVADKHGIPYDFWCNKAFDFAEERNWAYLPTPIQLYSARVNKKCEDWDVSMVDYITTKWDEYIAHQIIAARCPSYRADAEQVHLYQIKHRIAIMKQIKNRRNSYLALATYLYEIPVLVESEVARIFGNDMLERAKDFGLC